MEGTVSRLATAFRELGVVDAHHAALFVPVLYCVAGCSRMMFRLGYRASGAVPLTREVLHQLMDYLFGLLPLVESTVPQHVLRRVALQRDLCAILYMRETTARGKESGRLLVDDFFMRGLACRPAWPVIHGGGMRPGDVAFVEPGLGAKGKNTPCIGAMELELLSGDRRAGCLLSQLGE
jgi:hypothetical protein